MKQNPEYPVYLRVPCGNIRVTQTRNPYRTLTYSSGYPAAYNVYPVTNFLVVRDESQNSSSWPSS